MQTPETDEEAADVAAASRTPTGLAAGGRALWRAVTDLHQLDPMQQVQLLEACRSKDRLDKLDGLLRGDTETWATLTHDLRTEDYELRIDDALAKANATANLLKQLLAALRLPDAVSGQRPQVRSARGAYVTDGKATARKVSSLDRARAAKTS